MLRARVGRRPTATPTPNLSPVQPLTVHRSGSPDAPPVVLVHGLTDAGTTWPDLLAHWGDRWDVHAVDLRGHGRSPRFTDEQLADAPDVMLADLLAVLDVLAAPVALVGHSLGGLLSLRAALARPDQVWAVVLEDPAQPRAGGPNPEFVAWHEELLSTFDEAAQVERMLRETPWSRTEVEAWAACKPDVDLEYIRRGLLLGGDGWSDLFDRLTVPTLLVVPEDGEMAPRAEHLGNPVVRLATVAGAGHCVRRDLPDAYHEVVDAFLAERRPPA